MNNRLSWINRYISKCGFRLHHQPQDPFLTQLMELTERLRFYPKSDFALERECMEVIRGLTIRRLIDRYQPGLIIDVGANVGDFCSLVRLTGYQGAIMAVEPDPAVFSELCTKHPNAQNQINIQGLVGSECGEIEFKIAESSVFNSLYSYSTTGREYFEPYMKNSKTTLVQMKTLATWLKESKLSIPPAGIFLKTDTQGHDLQVLKGASELISAVKALLIEIPIENIYAGTPNREHLESHIATAGFQLSSYFPVSMVPDSARLLELDAIYVRAE